MKTAHALWPIAITLMFLGQDYALAGESRFIVGNKYRNQELYTHQDTDRKIDAYGEVDSTDINDRILQIKTLFPEIYNRFFTADGKLKTGFEWIDYQKAVQAHYSALKEDAKKLYGEKSADYKQIIKEIEEEEFNLGVARNFDNKFGNFTSSRSNFLLNVIPPDVLRELNQIGVRTSFQLKVHNPDIYRQYIGSKQLQSDFYLGPTDARIEPQSSCRPEPVANPVCRINTGSNAQDAAKSAAACARNQGDAKTSAKIAAETARQIGAGKKEAALILSAIGDSLNLNAAERNRLANDASKSMCSPACVVTNADVPSYLYPLPADTNAFDAARLAAQYAAQDKEKAARIAAETAVQIGASAQDQALILATVMDALKFDAPQKARFVKTVEDLNCTAMPADLNTLSPGAGNENSAPPPSSAGSGFDNPNLITTPAAPLASPN
jgi:hypothetical protein